VSANEAVQTTTGEKAALETRVAELERDLSTARVDLVTAGRQFTQTTNQLQVVTEEAT
jgi:hypothetical protein